MLTAAIVAATATIVITAAKRAQRRAGFPADGDDSAFVAMASVVPAVAGAVLAAAAGSAAGGSAAETSMAEDGTEYATRRARWA